MSKKSSTNKNQKQNNTFSLPLEILPITSNIFHELEKRRSILLNLFNVKTREAINHCGTAPSPSKDYCQLLLTFDHVIYRWWRVTRRHDADKFHPGEIKDTYVDFSGDDLIQRKYLIILVRFSYLINS